MSEALANLVRARLKNGKSEHVIRHRDGDYFLRTGPSKYSQTDNILQATQFDDNLLQGLADSIKRQYWAQVLEQGRDI